MRYPKSLYFFLLVLLGSWVTPSRSQHNMLLTDMTVQIECTEAVDSLYNFKFDVAERQFQWMRQSYPEHPLSYFLLGLAEFWKIQPNENITDYDDGFLAYMDTSLTLAKKLYDEDKTNPEATFFLAAGYGFKARILSDRGHYTKATFATKASLNYLNENTELGQDFSPEFLFGQGLYNYFREWIPDNKKFLKPIIMFFPKGDKELGMQQLDQVSNTAFYTRVEAMNFLMRIHGSYENVPGKALPIVEYLHETYPDNPVFHRYYAKTCHLMNKHLLTERLSKQILENIEAKKPGYESESGRVASYFLGRVYRYKGDTTQAALYYRKCLEFAQEINAAHKGYVLNSIEQLALFADKRGDIMEGKKWYTVLRKSAGENKSHATVKRAKKYLRKHRRVKSNPA